MWNVFGMRSHTRHAAHMRYSYHVISVLVLVESHDGYGWWPMLDRAVSRPNYICINSFLFSALRWLNMLKQKATNTFYNFRPIEFECRICDNERNQGRISSGWAFHPSVVYLFIIIIISNSLCVCSTRTCAVATVATAQAERTWSSSSSSMSSTSPSPSPSSSLVCFWQKIVTDRVIRARSTSSAQNTKKKWNTRERKNK